MFKLAQTTDGPQAEAKIPIGSLGTRKPASDQEDILLRAKALFSAEPLQDLREVVAQKVDALRHYDVLAMDRVVAILAWGRSGSVLLSSYLDGHEDIIMLPEVCGWRLHEFFDLHQLLPWRDKLIAYPVFMPEQTRLFEGDFAISTADYYASVQAIVEFYSNLPSEFLESRRAFFLFVHIAYNLALGRRPASPRPLIVYAQHDWNDVAAGHLVEDFPQAKFIHTVRDPISSCDAAFHFQLPTLAERHIMLPFSVLDFPAKTDRPQSGMESRTRAIRFEDLHSDLVGVMRDLTDWLGIPYQATLLDSTFNGIPYIVKRDGAAWSGPRLEQVQRHSWHFSLKDRALMFALLYENFADWNYPCPEIFRYPAVRCLVVVSLVLFPTKMEIIAAREVFRRRILPSVRHGKIWRPAKSVFVIGLCRLKIVRLLVPTFLRRCMHRPTLLQVVGLTQENRTRPVTVCKTETSETSPLGR